MAKIKIGVYNESLTMEFDGEIVNFKIFKEKVHFNYLQSCFAINSFDSLSQQAGNVPSIKEVEDSFVINDLLRKDEKVGRKRKKKKGSLRPLTSKMGHYVGWLGFEPP